MVADGTDAPAAAGVGAGARRVGAVVAVALAAPPGPLDVAPAIAVDGVEVFLAAAAG